MKPNTTTPTPTAGATLRTDPAESECICFGAADGPAIKIVTADFARQLERELAAAHDAIRLKDTQLVNYREQVKHIYKEAPHLCIAANYYDSLKAIDQALATPAAGGKDKEAKS